MTQIDLLIQRYPQLECCKNDILLAFELLKECYSNDGKLLACGNGGSAADAEHIVGELMKGFKKQRRISPNKSRALIDVHAEMGKILAENLQGALSAIALDGHIALSTAYMNDCEPLLCFAQQVNGYGCYGDVLLGISTSGNSKNIISATVVARALGIKIVGLTGAKGGELASVSDVVVKVPETETYMIQELHLPVYHCWCLMLEEHFFG